MRRRLYEYQRRAVDFILKNSGCGICMASEFGKEVIGLSVIWYLLYDYFLRGKIIVVADKERKAEWIKQIKSESLLENLKYVWVHGNEDEKCKLLQAEYDIYFADIHTFAWMLQQDKWKFDVVILDDLSKFNNEKKKYFQVIYQKRSLMDKLAGFLSDSHKLEDLWAEWLLIDGGKSLGVYKEGYFEKYFLRDNGRLEAKNDAKEAIYKTLTSSLFCVENNSHSDVPARIYKFEKIELDEREYSKYQWFKRGEHSYYDLAQLANGMWCDNTGKGHCLHTRKVNKLNKICALHAGRRILVLCWFYQDIHLILKHMKNAMILKTHDDAIAWQSGKIKLGIVYLANRNIMTSLRNKVDVLIWFSLNDAKEIYEEINNIAAGVNDNNRLWIYHLISRGTVDEEMVGYYIG